MKGRVKWFDSRKGYGFITGDNGEDVYVHYTALCIDGFRTLKYNQHVEYEVTTTTEGKIEAREVHIIAK